MLALRLWEIHFISVGFSFLIQKLGIILTSQGDFEGLVTKWMSKCFKNLFGDQRAWYYIPNSLHLISQLIFIDSPRGARSGEKLVLKIKPNGR